MVWFFRRLVGSDRAATLVEYSLIVCLIACAAIGAFTTVGGSVLNRLGPASNALT